jgi:hypothetical protein
MGSGCRKIDLVDALLPLYGGRRRERKKKKSPWGRRVSRGAGSALLVVLFIAAVRCN